MQLFYIFQLIGLRRSFRRLCCGIASALVLSLSVTPFARAEIYRYIDKNGVWHFTNINTDSRYRIFISSARKTPTEYIEEYGDIIRQASIRFGVDPRFIRAIIKAESAFDHTAVSREGAQGLMQLMPGTADDMAVKNTFDPEENIFGGTRYFSLLLKRFKNDKILALAAYNAGPETVESYNGMPPFPETKAFVKRVLDYYETYNSRAK
ncbi:MAG: lytic transglycosylase domain-containing protein [Proteobacteria bacterium]|nr:lytic transglycosylase domain-containing protein [Pseudomonadota bacterium]